MQHHADGAKLRCKGQQASGHNGEAGRTSTRRSGEYGTVSEVQELLLEVKGVSKAFAGVQALDQVDLGLERGTVHGVIGHNGAGKSTLMNILGGIVQPDSGKVRLDGEHITISRPRQAQEHGISMVHQELSVLDDLDIAENIFLGREIVIPGGLVNRAKLDLKAQELLGRLDLNWLVRTKCGLLSVGERQMVEIARAISWDASVLIFDEPTSALSQREQKALFDLIGRLKADGLGILYISHRLDEIMSLSDTVTVLRDGKNVGTHKRGEFDHAALIEMMLGQSAQERAPAKKRTHGNTILDVKDLQSLSGNLDGISLSLAEGEIVGLAGMLGSGRSEFFECLFGMRSFEDGSLLVDGKEVRPSSPITAMELGIGMVPEDRKSQGVFSGSSLWKNVTIASTHDLFAKFGIVMEGDARQAAQEQVGKLDIRCRSIYQDIGYLSGGNQQKAVLARWIMRNPRILLLDDPTAGIDVGAKAEIHGLIRDLAGVGIAVLMASSEFDELIEICDRILVIRDGKIIDEAESTRATEQSLVLAATGGAK